MKRRSKVEKSRVMYYDHEERKLTASMWEKAIKFVEYGLVEPKGSYWLVKPIAGYNTRTYTVMRGPMGLECNCQGFQTKLKKFNRGEGPKPSCSHCLAVEIFERKRNQPPAQRRLI